MSRYELMFIISPKVKEADMRPAADQIQKMITTGGGKVVEEMEWGKKKLAYPIKNYRHGFYYVIYFDTESAAIKNLERGLKVNDDLLRYLLIKLDAPAVKALAEQKKRALESPEAGETEATEPARSAAKAIPAKSAPSKITPEKPDLPSIEKKPVSQEEEPIVTLEPEAKPAVTAVPTASIKKETPASQEKKEKAKLDELDKKLDEILDEDITD